MGLFDFFKKEKKVEDTEPRGDLTLSDMKKGYMVDYDMKTWEIKAYDCYDWGDGDLSYEWQLQSFDEILYLELEHDDEAYWSLNRKIAFRRLGPKVKQHILETGDSPEEIVYEGTVYYLEETSGGHFMKSCQGEGAEVLTWDYEDDDGNAFLSIEQWGEREFEASVGFPVQEYQFDNILPRK